MPSKYNRDTKSRLPSRGTFVLLLLIPAGLGVLFSFLSPIAERLETPELALSWMGIFFALAISIQQGTNYLHGVVYMLMGKEDRATVDKSPQNKEHRKSIIARNRWGTVMKLGYWFCVVLLVLVSASLLVNTIRTPSNAEIKAELKRMADNTDNVTKRLDRLITIMETQNVSANVTTQK
jgi:hypothetical protein